MSPPPYLNTTVSSVFDEGHGISLVHFRFGRDNALNVAFYAPAEDTSLSAAAAAHFRTSLV